jgi:hypothetical protein
MLFAGGNEAVESKGVLTDVGMDEKRHFGMEFAESGISRKGNLDEVANAADIDEDLVRAFFGEATAKLANHGRPVLPPFLRLSTRSRVRLQSGEK